MAAVLAVGYSYGWVRAVLHDGFSHFIFDAAIAGLYAARLPQASALTQIPRLRPLYQWVAFLIGWPFVALAIGMTLPLHPLIQLVGLRAAIWFLPFLLIGMQANSADAKLITRALAILNLVALAIGLGEYLFGIEAFLPRNATTDLIYRCKDVAGHEHYRIPSTFVTSATYGGVMVASWPFLGGRWANPGIALEEWLLLTAGLLAAGIGVFLCGARTPVVFLLLLVAFTVYQLKSRLHYVLLIGLLGAGVAYVVAGHERLQRFTSLEDSEAVTGRLHDSANVGLVDLVMEYPMGAGLGSAFGTSIPSFLQQVAPDEPIGAENEYVRIGIEQGVVGLALWIGFLGWFFNRTVLRIAMNVGLLYSLTAFFVLISWGLAWLGVGILISIPSTAILLFLMGWLGSCACAPGLRTTLIAGLGRSNAGKAERLAIEVSEET
jgi:hypothetical protein